MRAIAPHWQAQKASWGEAECLLERLACPASLLCHLAAITSEDTGCGDAQSAPEPVIQLLASSVATILKAAKVTGANADFMLPCHFMNISALWRSTTGALPASISLLLPRMAGTSGQQQGASSKLLSSATAVDSVLTMSECNAPELCSLMVLRSCHMTRLVNISAAELLHCPRLGTTRYGAHFAAGVISDYAAYLSRDIAFGAGEGYAGAPSGSSQLHDLLARPLLHLLHSPLLDTLVALQHVMIGAVSGLRQQWESTIRASICPLKLCSPPSMEPDTMDSKVVMQVGHTYYSLEP